MRCHRSAGRYGLSHTSSTLLARLLTPILCRRSWTDCCYAYSGACGLTAVAWYMLAGDKPTAPAVLLADAGTGAGASSSAAAAAAAAPKEPELSPKPPPGSKQGLKRKGTAPPTRRPSQWGLQPKPAKKAEKAVEWGIFRVPAVAVTVVNFVSWASLNYSMLLMAPMYFTQKLGCTPEEAGRYLALVSSVNIPGAFIIGTLESALMRWKVPTLTVRRYTTTTAAFGQSACAMLYALAQTPREGFLAYLTYSIFGLLHSAGQFPNMLELGGKDTALLASVSNSLAQIPAIVVPALGLWLRRRTGSWVPQFAWVAAFEALMGLMWLRFCSCTNAREQLAGLRKSAEESA